jgi:hypothetical protein
LKKGARGSKKLSVLRALAPALPKPAVSKSFLVIFSKQVTSYFSVPSVAQIGLSGHAKANGIDKWSSLRMGDEGSKNNVDVLT